MILVSNWKPLTIITKRSILDVTADLDLPLIGKDVLESCFCRKKHMSQVLVFYLQSMQSKKITALTTTGFIIFFLNHEKVCRLIYFLKMSKLNICNGIKT